jgi:ubiquinone/menaquinone biosynthesis C-methylase UbiE
MLRQFKKQAQERGMIVEAVQGYAEALPFPASSFDAVVSRLAPHHFQDTAKAVAEMARIVKAGGRVAVIDLEGSGLPALDDLNHKIEVLHDPTHVRSLTASRWRELFEASDLTIDALESSQAEMPAGLSIRRWCEIGSAPTPAEAQIRRLLASTPKKHLNALGIRFHDGDFHIPVRTLIIVGRKVLSAP